MALWIPCTKTKMGGARMTRRLAGVGLPRPLPGRFAHRPYGEVGVCRDASRYNQGRQPACSELGTNPSATSLSFDSRCWGDGRWCRWDVECAGAHPG